MSYTVNIDNFDRSHWQEKAKEFADYSIYQTWPYQENRAEMSNCKISRAIVTNENKQVCLMCQVRIKHVKAIGLKVGYVQWGPLVRGTGNELKCCVSALIELRKAYLDNMVNVLRVVPNLPDGEAGEIFCRMLKAAGFRSSGMFSAYRTLAIKFNDGHEGLTKGLSTLFRRNLKKANKADLQIRHCGDKEGFDVLANLYSSLKATKGFKGVEIEEFSAPQQSLCDHEKMDLLMLYNEGRPISSVLSSNLGDSGILLLATANDEGRKLAAAYLNWHSSVMLSLESGKERYDLGGIDPLNNPGVYDFKSRMGGTEIYHVGAFDACKTTAIKAMWTLSDKAASLVKS
jgi:lipid II:glycine glycyltransferase (peptidoglycan interpeptide bridge formation enzyme)